ncbi:uncharacterized protein [Drosophila tropicalis]|uniref:uncharacterized protein n=1 Tax=Drosophila tropicalis TaxID=46794 RepID=UPI0035AC18E1
MIYADNCCCCIELRCGCILIAIIDVLIRGVDRFFVDPDTWMGFVSLVVSGSYAICCLLLLLGAVLYIRFLVVPYLLVALIRLFTLIWLAIYVIMENDFYDYVVFDAFQAVVGLYFCLVVYSFYDRLSNEI